MNNNHNNNIQFSINVMLNNVLKHSIIFPGMARRDGATNIATYTDVSLAFFFYLTNCGMGK